MTAATPRTIVKTRRRIARLGVAAAMLSSVAPRQASAAGLYFSDRGVRPLSRGGAFVAGADDLGAVWYNPAGIIDAGSSILVDGAWLNFSSEFTRQTLVTDASGAIHTLTSPTVKGNTPVLPLPTIAGSIALGRRKEWVIAGSVLAPYTAVASYPEFVNGQPSPSRYSLVSLDGSLLVEASVHVAYKPIEQIRIGFGVGAVVGTFQSTLFLSASPPDRLLSAPEDPTYDAFTQLKVGPIFAPLLDGGIIAIPNEHVRIGISGRLPTIISAPASVDVRLPTASPFDSAQQDGRDATVRFELPAIFRAGVEVRFFRDTRVEVAVVREFWTTQHAIDLTPKNIKLNNITGFPTPFYVSPISLTRGFDNANSYRIGGETPIDVLGMHFSGRLGFSYDQSAVPTRFLSPLTVDLSKYVLSMGASIHVGKNWRLDGLISKAFTSTTTVSPADAGIPRVNPVQGNPTATASINGGTYSTSALILGAGLQYKF